MRRLTLILTCMSTIFSQSQVYGHRVLGLVNYAEDVCTQTLSSNMVNEQELDLCKYKFLGILSKDESLVEVEQMAFILGYIFGESTYNNGLNLAKQIHNNCKGILNGVKGQLASERGQPFFDCVSKIIKISFDGDIAIPQRKLMARINSDVELKPDEKIYPDLSCHEGYNSNRSVSGDGEAYLLDYYKFCKYTRDPQQKKHELCTKICMAEYLGLIDTTYYGHIRTQWNRYGEMVNNVRQLIINHNTEHGRNLVNKILGACRQKMKLVETHRTNPCHTTRWRDFFECVDNVWDCRKVPQSALRE